MGRRELRLTRRHAVAAAAAIVQQGASSQYRWRVGAVDAVPLTLQQSTSMILERCSSDFLSSVLSTGRVLYRGEGIPRPALVSAPPDLLADAYGSDDALRFFESLERCLVSSGSLARPSTAHIAVARLEAAAVWGAPATIWPLGRLSYVWPTRRLDVWPTQSRSEAEAQCSSDYSVDRGLATALLKGHEILFATDERSSYVALPLAVCSPQTILRELRKQYRGHGARAAPHLEP
ncbi:hypothetical protein AB1Y20_017333 [Prymnesium parvum]|uniref:Uncharacterized protein n=1 Tax=Prymnesium parvum TaxID=97485 RepID=A0AB34JLT6_PRYPA